MPLSSNLSILTDSGVLITKHSKSLCIFFGADTSTNNVPSTFKLVVGIQL